MIGPLRNTIRTLPVVRDVLMEEFIRGYARGQMDAIDDTLDSYAAGYRDALADVVAKADQQ